MPVPGFKFRSTPVAWLVLAVFTGLLALVYTPNQQPAASGLDSNTLYGVVVVLADIVVYFLVHLLILLAYLIVGMLVVVVVLSPVLVLLALWLRRRSKRQRVERASWQSGKALRNPSPSVPPNQQPDERIPLLARRFKQPPSP
jgi:hypothetical protein